MATSDDFHTFPNYITSNVEMRKDLIAINNKMDGIVWIDKLNDRTSSVFFNDFCLVCCSISKKKRQAIIVSDKPDVTILQTVLDHTAEFAVNIVDAISKTPECMRVIEDNDRLRETWAVVYLENLA